MGNRPTGPILHAMRWQSYIVPGAIAVAVIAGTLFLLYVALVGVSAG
jgi:hypothetical protein